MARVGLSEGSEAEGCQVLGLQRQASPLEERGQDTGCSCGGGAGTLGVLLWGRGQDTGGAPVGGALTYTPQGGS